MTAGAPMLIALAATALAAAPATSPAFVQDCSIGRDGWDDIRRFRRCLQEYNPDRWGDPWLLHTTSRVTGNPTIVRLLLQEGWDPNAPDDGGRSPLHHGARNTNPMVVSHLLDAGADISARDNDGYTALHWAAAQSGNGRVIKVLLERGAEPLAESNDGRTPLHSALGLGYRAEPSVVSAMLEAAGGEHLTPLQLSVFQGDAMAVGRLLAEGADPNQADPHGWRPVHFAVPLAGLEVVSELLAAGAEPDARTVGGATALRLAASQAPEPVVSALLAAGSDPNAREAMAGWTPLHYAARYWEESILTVITVLLRAGAAPGSSPASSDDNGLSPLHPAFMNPGVTAAVLRRSSPRVRTRWREATWATHPCTSRQIGPMMLPSLTRFSTRVPTCERKTTMATGPWISRGISLAPKRIGASWCPRVCWHGDGHETAASAPPTRSWTTARTTEYGP